MWFKHSYIYHSLASLAIQQEIAFITIKAQTYTVVTYYYILISYWMNARMSLKGIGSSILVFCHTVASILCMSNLLYVVMGLANYGKISKS